MGESTRWATVQKLMTIGSGAGVSRMRAASEGSGAHLELLLALLRRSRGLDEGLEPALLVDEEVVILWV